MKTVADGLVAILIETGVKVVFGIPSIHNLGLYEALRKAPAIKHILCRHESTATHMADGYARESGKVGVVITSTGPGAGYAVPALQEAFGSSVPLLLITTNVPSRKIEKGLGSLHEVAGQEGMFRSITKEIFLVRSPSGSEEMTRQALRMAQSERPGPVYLEIPTDVFNLGSEQESFSGKDFSRNSRPLPNLKQAVSLLKASERPLILTGTAALRAGLSNEITALAETLAAPVLFSPGASGIISDDHPLALGNSARRGVVREAVVASDLALAVGTRLREVDAKRRGLELPRLIHMEWDDQWIGKNFPAEISLTGDLGLMVKALIKEIGALPRAEHRRAHLAELSTTRRNEADRIAGEQPALAYLNVIRNVLPRTSTLVVDNSQLGYWSEYFYPSHVPGGWMGAKGSAIIGFAFAAAVGAKIAAPERPMVAVIGDGGFLYGSQELATCVRHGIGFPLIVVNSRSYGIIGYLQEKFYQHEYETQLANPDFVRLAQSYGVKGCRVTSPTELEETLREALSSGEMWLIELLADFPEPPFDLY